MSNPTVWTFDRIRRTFAACSLFPGRTLAEVFVQSGVEPSVAERASTAALAAKGLEAGAAAALAVLNNNQGDDMSDTRRELEALTAPVEPPPDDDPTRYLVAELHKVVTALHNGATGLLAEVNSRDYGESVNRLNEMQWQLDKARVALEKLKGTWVPGSQPSAAPTKYEETEHIKAWALKNTKTLPLTRDQYERAMAEHPSRRGA